MEGKLMSMLEPIIVKKHQSQWLLKVKRSDTLNCLQAASVLKLICPLLICLFRKLEFRKCNAKLISD